MQFLGTVTPDLGEDLSANQVLDPAQLTAGNNYSLICLYLTLSNVEQDLFLVFLNLHSLCY